MNTYFKQCKSSVKNILRKLLKPEKFPNFAGPKMRGKQTWKQGTELFRQPYDYSAKTE
jgi:hypothetical protein